MMNFSYIVVFNPVKEIDHHHFLSGDQASRLFLAAIHNSF